MKCYLDIRLGLFVALTIGASLLSAHGAWLFFGYIVEPWLAWVFTLVVALGIIGLDAAATAEPGRMRYVYMAGAGFFLVLETLANYFAGQADFASKVETALAASGSADLLYIVREYPTGTRALVVLFLSLASISVAYFTYAATRRLQQLHDAGEIPLRNELEQVRADFEQTLADNDQLRAESARAATERDQLRAESARLRDDSARAAVEAAERLNNSAAELEQVRNDTEQVRTDRDDYRAEADRYVLELEQLRSEAAQLRTVRTEVETLSARETRATEQVRTAKAEAERLRDELAKRSAELREAQAVAGLDVRTIAQALRDQGIPLRTIAAALGVSEKTIRNWTTATEEV